MEHFACILQTNCLGQNLHGTMTTRNDKTPFIRFVLYLNKDHKTEYSRNNRHIDLSFVLRNPYRTTDTVQDPHEVT